MRNLWPEAIEEVVEAAMKTAVGGSTAVWQGDGDAASTVGRRGWRKQSRLVEEELTMKREDGRTTRRLDG